jgi:prophage regulatory protein
MSRHHYFSSCSSTAQLSDALQRCGLSRSSLYSQVAEDKFPKPVKISTRSVGWVESDLDDWIQSRISLAGQPIDIKSTNKGASN